MITMLYIYIMKKEIVTGICLISNYDSIRVKDESEFTLIHSSVLSGTAHTVYNLEQRVKHALLQLHINIQLKLNDTPLYHCDSKCIQYIYYISIAIIFHKLLK